MNRNRNPEIALSSLVPEIKEVQIGEYLGSGNFSEVRKGIAWQTTVV